VTFVNRLRAVAEPLYRECECGSDTIRWGATEPLVRVNAMRPVRALHPTLHAVEAAERTLTGVMALHRSYRRIQRKLLRGFSNMASEWDDFLESATANISLA
jgi:hypothetical protein